MQTPAFVLQRQTKAVKANRSFDNNLTLLSYRRHYLRSRASKRNLFRRNKTYLQSL